jgi:hypothetical protein
MTHAEAKKELHELLKTDLPAVSISPHIPWDGTWIISWGCVWTTIHISAYDDALSSKIFVEFVKQLLSTEVSKLDPQTRAVHDFVVGNYEGALRVFSKHYIPDVRIEYDGGFLTEAAYRYTTSMGMITAAYFKDVIVRDKHGLLFVDQDAEFENRNYHERKAMFE